MSASTASRWPITSASSAAPCSSGAAAGAGTGSSWRSSTSAPCQRATSPSETAPMHLDALDQRRLRRIRVRHDHAALALPRGSHDRGQHPRHGPQPPVESEFADVDGLRDRGGIHRSFGRERGDRDRDVEGRPVLGQTRRRQIHRQPAARQREPAVLARVVHALHRFAERFVGEPDDAELRLLVGQIGFDLDERAVESGQGDRPRARGGHRTSSRCSSAPVAGSGPMIAIASTRSRRPCAASGWAAIHANAKRHTREQLAARRSPRTGARMPGRVAS